MACRLLAGRCRIYDGLPHASGSAPRPPPPAAPLRMRRHQVTRPALTSPCSTQPSAPAALLTRALYPDQPAALTAASLIATPFRPFLVSTLHTLVRVVTPWW